VLDWLARKHGKAALTTWRERNESVAERADRWDRELIAGRARIKYLVDHDVRSERHVTIDDETLHIDGLPPISLLD
jgi:hypothetical protein